MKPSEDNLIHEPNSAFSLEKTALLERCTVYLEALLLHSLDTEFSPQCHTDTTQSPAFSRATLLAIISIQIKCGAGNLPK